MAQFICYGEDGLTLWALKDELDNILKQLGDSSGSKECKIIYRPSFGRKGAGSEFGEFDSILATEQAVYLIESKWIRFKKSILEIEKVQLLRHGILKWYFANVDESVFKGGVEAWQDFRTRRIDDFNKKFSKSIPGAETELAQNILTTLTHLHPYANTKRIINVLMLFLNDDVAAPTVKFASNPTDERFDKIIKIKIDSKGWKKLR